MVKILELFGGIGACTEAFKKIEIPFKIVDYVEIDKYAVQSYNAINKTNFEPQDITKWDKDIEVDFIMHGSPCQDFSLAGKQAGGDQNSGTRSSLMYETLRIVKKLKPKYVLWENVKNVISKKHIHNFNKYLQILELEGYNNYYQVLNAKDYGIPQNRERVFCLSIRKDIDNGYIFPNKEELKLRIKDILEENIDEKYYLSKQMMKYIISDNNKWLGNNNKSIVNKSILSTITTGEGTRRCDASNYICDELSDNFDLKRIDFEILKIKNATKQGYDMATDGDTINLNYPDSKTRRGRVGHQVSQTITTNDSIAVVEQNISNLRIRKLTPKECWRLMGFNDESFDRVKTVGISDTQLYKQAGNSIVVDVLEKILKNLFKGK